MKKPDLVEQRYAELQKIAYLYSGNFEKDEKEAIQMFWKALVNHAPTTTDFSAKLEDIPNVQISDIAVPTFSSFLPKFVPLKALQLKNFKQAFLTSNIKDPEIIMEFGVLMFRLDNLYTDFLISQRLVKHQGPWLDELFMSLALYTQIKSCVEIEAVTKSK
jgi:hypothetical protein